MRVTHIITRLIVGGAQENTIASVLGLQARPGLKVDLISGTETGPEGSLAHAFDHSPDLLTWIPELVRSIHPWKDLLAWKKLVRLFQERRPDLVHTHSGKAGILGRLAAHRAGVPIIVHTIHGPSFGPFQGNAANFLFRAAERRAGKITTHFVAVAQAMIDQYLAAGIGRPDQYTKIFSGFPLGQFLNATNDPALRARHGLAPDDLVIGKIARFFNLKGHADLFRIAPELLRRNPKVKLLLVGDGPLLKDFAARARELDLQSRIIFTGLVPPSEIAPLVGIMDMLVHLSLREGLARALPQALATARPVVAYDCDGAREICRDGETGFLVRAGDIDGLRARLQTLIDQPALRERLGLAGQTFVRENFGQEKMVAALFELYSRLAAGNKLSPP